MYDPIELQKKEASELHARRAEILALLQNTRLEDAPTELLQELAFIFGALRRKTSGPPAKVKASKRAPAIAASSDELMDLLS